MTLDTAGPLIQAERGGQTIDTTDTGGTQTTTGLVWDPAGGLPQVATTTTGGVDTNYQYGLGRTIAITESTPAVFSRDVFASTIATTDTGGTQTTTGLVWDPSGGLSQVATTTTGGVDTNFLYGLGRAVAITETSPATFSRDVFASTITTPATADLATAASYDPWGNPTDGPQFADGFGAPPAETGPTFGYRSELHFGNQQYLRARWYQPNLARFTSHDPQGGTPGTPVEANPFHYAANNPVNNLDPTGEYIVGDSAFLLAGFGFGFSMRAGSWYDRQDKYYSTFGTKMRVRGYIDHNCLRYNSWCATRGSEPGEWTRPEDRKTRLEYTGVVAAMRRLCHGRGGIWDQLGGDGLCGAVDWEVRHPRDSNGYRIDIVEGETNIYEAKVYVGKSTTESVDKQLDDYMSAGAYKDRVFRGSALLWWATAVRDKCFWCLDGGDMLYVWSPKAGHVYVSRDRRKATRDPRFLRQIEEAERRERGIGYSTPLPIPVPQQAPVLIA